MLLAWDSAPFKRVAVTAVVVILLTLSQNVIGRCVRAESVSVPPYNAKPADFAHQNLVRLRRTSSSNFTAEDYVRPERHAFKGHKWPKGIVPYKIDLQFMPQEKALIAQAFEEYAKKTCIRFVPKAGKNKHYVDIQLDNEVCGSANVCRQGGKQFVKLGRKCMDLNTVLHELGHAICLAHEHEREDRENFIELTENVDKDDHNFGIAGSDHTTLGLWYDYESVMHYDCPYFFKPKSEDVRSCGKNQKLSVLDAEKINLLYKCGGCHSYRFRQPQKAQQYVVKVGYDIDGKKLGICRGFLDGDIVPGKYRPHEMECDIPWGRKEHKLTTNFEVLTLRQSKYFSWISVKNGRMPENAVPGGRQIGGIPLYIGRCTTHVEGKKVDVPGHVRDGKMFFSVEGKQYKCLKYEVFVCAEKS